MEQSMKKQIWAVAAIALATGLILGAFLYSRIAGAGSTPGSSSGRADEEQSFGEGSLPYAVHISPETQMEVGIAVEAAALQNLQDSLSATGTVREDPGLVAHIRPLARGLIEKTYVRLGDRVSAGDPLVEYDNIELGLAIGEYQSAQAELQRSLTDLEVKKTILERGREMLKVGAIARTAFDLLEAEHKDAQARTTSARANIAKIEAQIRRFGWTNRNLDNLSEGRAEGDRVSYSVLKAPFPGIITAYHASVGEAVEPSTELLTITDMSSLWVLADVYEKDLSHVRTGKAVHVHVSSYPEKVFEGKITYVADTIDSKTQTAKVRCEVENRNGLLKVGMFATVDIPVDPTKTILAVPDSAIQQIEGNPVVFVRATEEEFQMREVQTGISRGGYTEIRSGIQAGDLLASRGSFIVKAAFLRDLIGEDE